MLALVQTDAELDEILMRAFILRRAELIVLGVGQPGEVGTFPGRRSLFRATKQGKVIELDLQQMQHMHAHITC
jgi:hypothetical protein